MLTSARVILEDLPPAGLAYLLAQEELSAPILLLTASEDRVDELCLDLRSYGFDDVVPCFGDEHVPFEDVSPEPRIVAGRLSLRHRCLTGARPPVVVASAAVLQGLWMPREHFCRATEVWVPGDELDRDSLAEHFLRCGYQRVGFVEDEGTFAIRGGIVDVFPPGHPQPVRLDLFGDDIAAIKRFDPESQRTLGRLESLEIHPIRDVVFDDVGVELACQQVRQLAEHIDVPSRRVSAILQEIESRNYFFGIESLWPIFYSSHESIAETLLADETVLVWDDAHAIEKAWDDRWQRATAERERALKSHRLTLELGDHLLSPAELHRRTAAEATPGGQLVAVPLWDQPEPRPHAHKLDSLVDLVRETKIRRENVGQGEILDPLEKELRQRFEQRYEVFVACNSSGSAERLRELFLGRKIDLPIRQGPLDLAPSSRKSPRRELVVAPLSAGLCDDEARIAIITDGEIFGGAPSRRARRRKRPPAEGLTTLRDLRDGEPVIHVDHGIGRYLGLQRLVVNGVDGDYVHLEYAGGDKLYLPIYRLNLLQRYRGHHAGDEEASQVRLDKLGGTRWERAKQRVKDAVLSLAHDLLALQARRKTLKAVALPQPDEHFRAFEASFAFEETPDQERAIGEVLADLQEDAAMDRLVCGDVGFGKTEVAIRAAYLAVLGGKQVAVLVPTTVLAEQHGMTFNERLKGEGVVVEVLSRFRTPKAAREILARLAKGAIDVLIGTHRLFSADVVFKELGLLVVDEEQRFGVKHKERIKQLKNQVHALTLSATPIPRTMHMAMVGLRDLSIIQTAPLLRTAVRTEVTRFDEGLIAEAIRRELHRGGQVFVVHNRVQSIAGVVSLVQRLVPEAQVAMAHGQMSGDRLERIMVDFVRREHNVLVCTAIIESGIDIPSANTMIVNRADTFGLSQLYQLRGRIGRGRDRAYAYLLLPRGQRITSEATERLRVLKRFSELGAGFQIASHDLDIRGAGNLLGAEQSGNIAAVGFELYTELLAEAVEQARGAVVRSVVEPDIKLPVSAVLPENYVPEPTRRLAFYQRMAQADSDATIFDVCAEIRDLYGEPPGEMANLAEVMVIRRRLMALGASALSAAAVDDHIKVGVTFLPEASIDRQALARRLTEEPERYRLLPSGRLAITAKFPSKSDSVLFLRRVREELGAFE